jgi:hypothetical protein
MTISKHPRLLSFPTLILATAVTGINGIANFEYVTDIEKGNVYVVTQVGADEQATDVVMALLDGHSTEEEKYIIRPTNRKRRRVERSMVEKSTKGNNHHECHDNVFERHSSSFSSSQKGSKSYKSTKESKGSKNNGKGKGKGKGGDNCLPVVHPTIPPVPSLPPNQLPPIHLPTSPPTDNPASAVPTIDDNREPEPPSGNNQTGQCTPNSAGLYGSQLGFAEESPFSYQVTTIPSVTADEMNLFVLPNIEDAIARGVLPQIFESCNNVTNTTTNVSRNDDLTSPPTPSSLNGYVLVDGTYVYQHENQRGRQRVRRGMMMYDYRILQGGRDTPPQQIEGVSTQPADEVAEGVACVNQNVPNLNCFVIRGSMTTYSREKQTEETQAYIQNAIQIVLTENTSELVNADNRILDVGYRDTDLYPIPEVPDDDLITDDVPNGSNPTQIPVMRPDTSERSFGEPWQYALIAVAVGLILATIYLCVRRPNGRGVFLSSDEKEDADDVEENGEMDPLATGTSTFGVQPAIYESDRMTSSYRLPENAYADATAEQRVEEEKEVESHEQGDEEFEEEEGDHDEQYVDDEQRSDEGSDEKEYEPALETSMDDKMNNEGEWLENDEFEDEPTYEERLNDENSPSSGENGVTVTTGSGGTFGAASSFGDDTPERPEPSVVSNDQTADFLDVASEGPYTSVGPQGPASATSFSAAIARAMSQAKGEKSETEFSPFDAIYDDNIYGATIGDGQEYEFRNTMPMSSSHHSSESNAASSEFEEVSVEEEIEEDEYEIEYTTESDEGIEEEFISDEEDESYGSYN